MSLLSKWFFTEERSWIFSSHYCSCTLNRFVYSRFKIHSLKPRLRLGHKLWILKRSATKLYYTPSIFNRNASKHFILCKIERGTRWWRSHAAAINNFEDVDSWSWKTMEFPKIWPLICHNWVKYWPRTKNNTTNREYSARAICWSFPRSCTTLRLETPRGDRTPPPPCPGEGGETPYPGGG